jgi:hypothetical protein
MTATIGALSPVFTSYARDSDRFCTTEHGRRNLDETGRRLVRTGDLAALYAVKGAEPGNDDPSGRGRIIALARALPMPPGRGTADFGLPGILTLRGNRLVIRWPHGWPSEVVFFSEHGGPHLDMALYATRSSLDLGKLLEGPIDLSTAQMRPLRDHLMAEILYTIERRPETRLREF